MKNLHLQQSNLLRFSTILIILSSLFSLISCSGNLKQENTPTLGQNSIQIDHTALDVVNLTSNEVKEGSFIKNKYKLSQTQADISKQSGQLLIEKLKSYFTNFSIPISEAPKYITLYTMGSMKDIELTEIKGISLFTFKGNGLIHHFYTANGQHLTEDIRFNVNTDYFYTTEMHLIGNYIFKNPSIKWAMFAMPITVNARLTATSFTTLNKINTLSNAIIKVTGIQVEGDALLSDGCGSCATGAYGNCTQDHSGWWCCETCDAPLCESEAINANGAPIGLKLDLQTAYSFKDNFMMKSDVGRKYINYYYVLSKAAFDKKIINSETVRDYFDFATKVYLCAKVMQFGENDEIVCDRDFQKQALRLINEYRTFSDDKDYQDGLATIENDLNKFSGKNKAYIMNNWK